MSTKWARAKREIRNNAGEVIHPGDLVRICNKASKKNGFTLEIERPKARISRVSPTDLEVLP